MSGNLERLEEEFQTFKYSMEVCVETSDSFDEFKQCCIKEGIKI